MVDDFTMDNQKYQYIMDAVGQSTFSRCRPLLHPHGIYTSSGGRLEILYLPLLTRVWGGKRVVFANSNRYKRKLEFYQQSAKKGSFILLSTDDTRSTKLSMHSTMWLQDKKTAMLY
jgi:hypothetical protein